MKVKYTLIFIAFVFFGCSKKKQNIESEKTISDKGVYYYNLTKQEKYSDYQRINFLNKAFGLTYNLQNTKESRNLLSDIVFQYYNFEINDGFNNSSKLLLKNSLAASDSINLGKAYRSRAFYYKNSGKIDSSFIYFSKAEKLYLKLDNEEVNISNVYLNKGVIQYLASDFLGAELSLTRAYRIYKDSENK
ncbi:MAG: hypothetical protein K9I26_04520, partial [Flavobacterium sp.]|nr:hypothetical protein [Flavobacterium sp.]